MRVIVTPARSNFATASVNAAAGSGRRSSKATVSKMARCSDVGSGGVTSTQRAPWIRAKTAAASATVWVSGPTVSNLAHRGTTPLTDTNPAVVLNPTKSFHAAGIRTDPPVSDPIAAGAKPNTTLAAAPDDDPPDTAAWSFTQGGVCVTGFRPNPEKANSDIWVLPKQTDPPNVALVNTCAS